MVLRGLQPPGTAAACPPAASPPAGNGTAFRLGDRVQQVRNNPHRGEAGVFNGSSGTITAVDVEAHQLTVSFPDGEVATSPSPTSTSWSTRVTSLREISKGRGFEFPEGAS
ncbi:hypothetical protein [Streptomyces sp. NPDC021562]|uniref:hypothetical protein n=1 Tax=Streptomyces sp. NPDC021562 TaxID=3155121 RepID=UPI0033E7984B